MKPFIVLIESYRSKKDGSFNAWGGQSMIRKEFDSLSDAKKFVTGVKDDLCNGNVPSGLKTTDKTSYVEIVGFKPFDGISSRFSESRIPFKKSKKKFLK